MEILRKLWWALALVGLLFLAIGFWLLFDPDVGLAGIMTYLGGILGLFGLILLISGWRAQRRSQSTGALFFFGALQVALATLILSNTEKAGSAFAWAIGGWAIVMGLSQVAMGLGRKQGRLWYLINGLISAALGILILKPPFDSPQASGYLLAFYTLLLGIFVLYYSVKLKRGATTPSPEGEKSPAPKSED